MLTDFRRGSQVQGLTIPGHFWAVAWPTWADLRLFLIEGMLGKQMCLHVPPSFSLGFA